MTNQAINNKRCISLLRLSLLKPNERKMFFYDFLKLNKILISVLEKFLELDGKKSVKIISPVEDFSARSFSIISSKSTKLFIQNL